MKSTVLLLFSHSLKALWSFYESGTESDDKETSFIAFWYPLEDSLKALLSADILAQPHLNLSDSLFSLFAYRSRELQESKLQAHQQYFVVVNYRSIPASREWRAPKARGERAPKAIYD